MNFPDDSQRLTIVGRTGSGKTIAALYQFSMQSYDEMPWIVVDMKIDHHLNQIPFRQEFDIDSAIPSEPGVYITHPRPGQDDERIEKFLWKVWSKRNVGLLFDEGMTIHPRSKSLRACLIQGRSLCIPVIMLSQRPVEVCRYAFSEADFFQVFHLNDDGDRETIERFLPHSYKNANREEKKKGNDEFTLPRFHSYYYDVGNHDLSILKPVPSPDEILAVFAERLKKRVAIVRGYKEEKRKKIVKVW